MFLFCACTSTFFQTEDAFITRRIPRAVEIRRNKYLLLNRGPTNGSGNIVRGPYLVNRNLIVAPVL